MDRRETRSALAGELADLLYHALVVTAERGIPAADIVTTLRDRHRPG
jgi:phosphoribosyl-ATP pyrophosphohydrolase